MKDAEVTVLWPTGLLAPCAAVTTNWALTGGAPALLVELVQHTVNREWYAVVEELAKLSGQAGWPRVVADAGTWVALGLKPGVSLDRVLEVTAGRRLPDELAVAVHDAAAAALAHARAVGCERISLAEPFLSLDGTITILPRLAALEADGAFYALGAARVVPPPVPTRVGPLEHEAALATLDAALGRDASRTSTTVGPDVVSGLLRGLLGEELRVQADLFEEAAAGRGAPRRDFQISEAEHATRAVRQRPVVRHLEIVVRERERVIARVLPDEHGSVDIGSHRTCEIVVAEAAPRHARFTLGWSGDVIVRPLEGEVRLDGAPVAMRVAPRGVRMSLAGHTVSIEDQTPVEEGNAFSLCVAFRGQVHRFALVGDEVWIGRDGGCDITIGDVGISPVHATVVRRGNELFLAAYDEHSQITRMGTTGGHPVVGEPMRRNVRYRLGEAAFIFRG